MDDVERYADFIDRLFCRPNAQYQGYVRVDEHPTVVVPGVMARTTLQRGGRGQESELYELTLFDNVDGFAGELWERSAKTMLQLQPLNHQGLPEISQANHLPTERVAFTLTKERGRPLDLNGIVPWAAEHPKEAFEEFSVLIDALKQLHGARILHRSVSPSAIRVEDHDAWGKRFSLARFEMSSLIGNVVRRRVGSQEAAEVREIVRQLYLAPPDGDTDPLSEARQRAYLPPEMHNYLFVGNPTRREWNRTDVFGLGVLGWELFCGGLPQQLPDELAGVSEASGASGSGLVVALDRLHRAMRERVGDADHLPPPLRRILGRMLRPDAGDRWSSYELALRMEQDWDIIHSSWENVPEQPLLVAFMPEQSVETIYNQRRWVSRSPVDAAGRQELQMFLTRELREAYLVHSRSGALGYATGPDNVLREAEWVLIGERAVWFCSYLREGASYDAVGGKKHEQVLLIKYFRESETAKELYEAQPRRRVPAVDLISYRPNQQVAHLLKKRSSWKPLTDSVREKRSEDPENDRFLRSLDFLLDYQQVSLEARVYPYEVVGDPDGEFVELKFDSVRDQAWRHRSKLLMAYALDHRLRPALGDFVRTLGNEGEVVRLALDGKQSGPSFTGDPLVVDLQDRLDAETIRVSRRRGKVPTTGWLRPAEDGGSRANLARQFRARQALDRLPKLVSMLRQPISIDLGRRQWDLTSLGGLRGNAPSIIRDMLTVQPFYALQGPPGTGKTTAASRALDLYLRHEPANRVLVSAQSNYALDNLAERLIRALPPDTLVLREVSETGERGVGDKIRPYLLANLTNRTAKRVVETLRRRLSGAEAGDAAGLPLSGKDRELVEEWLESVVSSQIELAEHIKAGASVVLATCSMAATLFDGPSDFGSAFDWVIVEEAAKAWPSEVIIPLVLGSRWTLIGDYQQLGAHRASDLERFLNSLQDHRTETIAALHAESTFHLRVLNLFKSMFNPEPPVVPDDALPLPAKPAEPVRELGRLNRQFRMHRDIAQPISRVFYPLATAGADDDGLPLSFLESDESALRAHGVTSPSYLRDRPLVWLDTTGHPDCFDVEMWSNSGEVAVVKSLVEKMRPVPAPADESEEDSLAILTPYRKQVQLLKQHGDLAGRVNTVHSFQGREADRVIVSLVRTRRRGDRPMSNVGHVGDDDVANVLLSRARKLLVLVGSMSHFADNGGPSWQTLTQVVRRYGHVVPATDWSSS